MMKEKEAAISKQRKHVQDPTYKYVTEDESFVSKDIALLVLYVIILTDWTRLRMVTPCTSKGAATRLTSDNKTRVDLRFF